MKNIPTNSNQCSNCAAARWLSSTLTYPPRMPPRGSTPPPTGLTEHVINRPLETCTTDPELVLFIVTPKQACRLGQLLQFDDGLPLRPELGGSTCHQIISFPLVSGEPAVALGDWTNRSPDKFAYDELFVTVPWHRMHNMMAAIPRCTAGEAKMVRPPGFDSLED